MIVAIDGPAGSGKSTVARAVAERLGLDCLETGGMYRAVAVAVLRRGHDVVAPDEMAAIARTTEIEVADGHITVDGEDVTDETRTPRVGRMVSAVAAVAEVRTQLVARQREWVDAHGGAVVEGRDIGSVVFPDADLKVFLTATPEERARRRQDEDADAVRRRDHLDSTRAVSPLVVPDGAVVIDSTGRSIDEIVDEIVGLLPKESPGMMRLGRVLYWVVRNLTSVFSRVYFRAAYRGLENVPQTGAFVLAPIHRSNLDFALMSVITKRRMRYMGKESLWKPAWFGRIIAAMGAYPVSRGTADREALRRTIEVLGEGDGLVLFPEGTRRSGPEVEEFFEGAAFVASRAGVPIVPVGIGGTEKALGKGARFPRPVKVRVIVGPPLLPPELPEGRRHPSRKAIHEMTHALQRELQRLFDEADGRPGRSGSSISPAKPKSGVNETAPPDVS